MRQIKQQESSDKSKIGSATPTATMASKFSATVLGSVMDNKFSVALVTCVSSGILVIESLSFEMETVSVVVILNGVVTVSDVVVSVSSVFVSSSDALTTLVV